jgi:tripartite-type tricarboxylate transporter receptor subunit TctC
VYAIPGAGSTSHLAAEMFRQAAGIDITDVGYRGGTPAIQGLIAGEAGLLFMSSSGVMQGSRMSRVVR